MPILPSLRFCFLRRLAGRSLAPAVVSLTSLAQTVVGILVLLGVWLPVAVPDARAADNGVCAFLLVFESDETSRASGNSTDFADANPGSSQAATWRRSVWTVSVEALEIVAFRAMCLWRDNATGPPASRLGLGFSNDPSLAVPTRSALGVDFDLADVSSPVGPFVFPEGLKPLSGHRAKASGSLPAQSTTISENQPNPVP